MTEASMAELSPSRAVKHEHEYKGVAWDGRAYVVGLVAVSDDGAGERKKYTLRDLEKEIIRRRGPCLDETGRLGGWKIALRHLVGRRLPIGDGDLETAYSDLCETQTRLALGEMDATSIPFFENREATAASFTGSRRRLPVKVLGGGTVSFTSQKPRVFIVPVQ